MDRFPDQKTSMALNCFCLRERHIYNVEYEKRAKQSREIQTAHEARQHTEALLLLSGGENTSRLADGLG